MKNRGRKSGGAWLIKLTWGKFAIIDAEDYERVSQYNWCGVDDGRCWYAHTFQRDGTPMAMHRLILNAPKGLIVDHINHNGLDNRKSNLRLCTIAQSIRNTRPHNKPNRTSQYKGVWLDKKRNVFVATISCNKKRYFLGRFKLETDAAKAYDKKAKELFGQFAYLNFPAESTKEQRETNTEHRRPFRAEGIKTSNVEPLRGLIQQIPPLRSE